MAEKLIRVFYEGNDDKAVLEALQARKVLPDNLEIAKRNQGTSEGRDGMIDDIVTFVHPTNGVHGKALVLVDRDQHSPLETIAWFEKQLRTHKHMQNGVTVTRADSLSGSTLSRFDADGDGKVGRVVVVPVGLEAPPCAELGITQFSMDDFVLRLLLHEPTFNSITEFTKTGVTAAMIRKKLFEIRDVLIANKLAVEKGKRFVHIARAVIGFGATTATMIDKLFRGAANHWTEVGPLLKPLIDDLRAAHAMLDAV